MKKVFVLILFSLMLLTNIFAQENVNNKPLIGGYVGVGYGILTGNISDYISNPFIVPLTGDIIYKGFVGQINLDAGFSKVNKTMKFDDGTSWNDGDGAYHNAIGVNLGYSVFNNNNVRVTPLVGYAFSYISKKWWGSSDISQNEPEYNMWNFALIFDIKNIFNSDKSGDNPEYVGLRITAGVYLPMSEADMYSEYYDGSTIYFSVGVVNLSIL